MIEKTITSLAHPLVKHWVRLKNSRSYRNEEKRLLLEGKSAVRDVQKIAPVRRLIYTANKPDIDAQEYFFVTHAIYKKISGVDEKEGIIAEFDLPETTVQGPLKYLLVSDRIQDPGNLGTLIRSACALHWDAVFLLEGSVDPFNDKALRAAKGATFSIPLLSGSYRDLEKLCEKHALSVIAADLTGTPLSSALCKENIALVLGNEGQGVSLPEYMQHAKVTIPIKNETESLNVAQAGAIFLYYLRACK